MPDGCATGYHMASLWEMLDTTHRTIGDQRDDSGYGPPAFLGGWVRTGYGSSAGTTAGMANCNAWTSNSSGDYGPYAQLPRSWTVGAQDIHVWEVGNGAFAPRLGQQFFVPRDNLRRQRCPGSARGNE